MNGFPNDFFWGATLSAHAIEGGDFNSDWWRWEQRPQRIRNAATSKEAADHYRRFSDDIGLARKLGLNALTYGVSWARVHPAPDHFDEEALGHYRSVFGAMHSHGITPLCVLQEVALPDWAAQRGGWENASIVEHFRKYAGALAQSLGGWCRWWIPIAEPMHWLVMAYREKRWPASRKALGRWLALRHMALAHAAAAEALRDFDASNDIGVSVRAATYLPENPHSAWDLRTARAESRRQLHGFPLLLGQSGGPVPFDFVAASYYGRGHVRFDPLRAAGMFTRCVRNDGGAAHPGGEMPHPAGLLDALKALQIHGKPILIVGNGLATDDDAQRVRFLLDHVAVLARARQTGADVRGYFHRALLDGFEWTQGYCARHGLVHVDWDTLARTPNRSAYLLRDIAEQGGIHPGTVARYCPGWTPPEAST